MCEAFTYEYLCRARRGPFIRATTALLLLYHCFTTALLGARRGPVYWHPTALLLLYYCIIGGSQGPLLLASYCATTALLLHYWGLAGAPFTGTPTLPLLLDYCFTTALLLLYYCIIGGSQDPFYGHHRAASTSTSASASAAPPAAHTRMSSAPPAAAAAPAAVSVSAEGVCVSIKGNLAAAGGDGKLGGVASGMMIDRDNSTALRNLAPELKMGRFVSRVY